jgi:hypothetical protein
MYSRVNSDIPNMSRAYKMVDIGSPHTHGEITNGYYLTNNVMKHPPAKINL